MRRNLWLLLAVPCLLGAAPSRTQTYVAGQVIDPADVTENEDNLYSYLQAGVDTYRTGTITATALASAAVTTAKIDTGAVTTATLADNAVTGAKMAMGSDAQGDVLYYNGTDWARLGAGTDGQFLETNGASANPSWSTVDVPVADRVHRTAGDVTTTSGTLEDFTGASITLTTAANPVLIGWSATCSHSTLDADTRFNVDIDGALVLGTTGVTFNEFTAGQPYNCSFAVMSADLTAASHTIKLQWSTSASTATATCDSAVPCQFWVVEVDD